MNYPRKIVIRKRLSVRVRVRVRIVDMVRVRLELGLGLRLGLTKNDSRSLKKTIVVHFKKILFCVFARHRIEHGLYGTG